MTQDAALNILEEIDILYYSVKIIIVSIKETVEYQDKIIKYL